MAILLITYDLNKQGQDYAEFYALRNKYPYARLSESSYAIQTEETPRQIFDKFSAAIDQNDYLFVVTLRRPYWGFGPEKVIDWLEARLT